MTRAKTNIGIVGFGRLAEQVYVPMLQNRFPDTRIAAVYDTDIDRLEKLKNDLPGIATYTRYEEFLAADTSAVLICTPNWSHWTYSQRALEKGKHVFCEKPIALNTQEAKNVVKAARDYNRTFMVSSPNRFRPDIVKLHSLISNSEFGSITSIRCGWVRRAGIPHIGSWFTNKRLSGGGSLTDLGSHLIDVIMYLANDHRIGNVVSELSYSNEQPITEASWYKPVNSTPSGVCDVEISAKCAATLGDLVTVSLETSWDAPVTHDTTFIEIGGTSGHARFESLFGMSPNGTRPSVSGYARYSTGREFQVEGCTDITQPFDLQLQDFFHKAEGNEASAESMLQRYVASAQFLESAYSYKVQRDEDSNIYCRG